VHEHAEPGSGVRERAPEPVAIERECVAGRRAEGQRNGEGRVALGERVAEQAVEHRPRVRAPTGQRPEEPDDKVDRRRCGYRPDRTSAARSRHDLAARRGLVHAPTLHRGRRIAQIGVLARIAAVAVDRR
jgi:hypothetical protein